MHRTLLSSATVFVLVVFIAFYEIVAFAITNAIGIWFWQAEKPAGVVLFLAINLVTFGYPFAKLATGKQPAGGPAAHVNSTGDVLGTGN